MNDAGSEVMERLLEKEGYRKIDSPEGADVIILNRRIIKYCVPRTIEPKTRLKMFRR